MDPDFKYVHSSETDVAKTFARIRRQLKEQATKAPANVKPLKKKEPK